MKRKILVSGATSKEGSAVVNSLHDHGQNVVAAINHPENVGFFKRGGIGTDVLDFNKSRKGLYPSHTHKEGDRQ